MEDERNKKEGASGHQGGKEQREQGKLVEEQDISNMEPTKEKNREEIVEDNAAVDADGHDKNTEQGGEELEDNEGRDSSTNYKQVGEWEHGKEEQRTENTNENGREGQDPGNMEEEQWTGSTCDSGKGNKVSGNTEPGKEETDVKQSTEKGQESEEQDSKKSMQAGEGAAEESRKEQQQVDEDLMDLPPTGDTEKLFREQKLGSHGDASNTNTNHSNVKGAKDAANENNNTGVNGTENGDNENNNNNDSEDEDNENNNNDIEVSNAKDEDNNIGTEIKDTEGTTNVKDNYCAEVNDTEDEDNENNNSDTEVNDTEDEDNENNNDTEINNTEDVAIYVNNNNDEEINDTEDATNVNNNNDREVNDTEDAAVVNNNNNADVNNTEDVANVNNNNVGEVNDTEDATNANDNNETDEDDNEQPHGQDTNHATEENTVAVNTDENDGQVAGQDAIQEATMNEASAEGSGESEEDGNVNEQTVAKSGDKTTSLSANESKAPDGLAQETIYKGQQDTPQEGNEATKETESKVKEEEPAEAKGQVGGEVAVEDEQIEKIPVDFFYNYEDHASKAKIAEESGLPEDMISLYHSFGYDCKKMSNLHMIDKTTVIFAAGNMVQLINLLTKEQRYIRSTSGGGIGAITVHPSRKYFAVAEKGINPNINMYEYPSLNLYRILRHGTERAYSYVDFNPAGTLLASVGSAPDYMLTVWDWMQESIMLRSKAFSQDVFRVTFSPDNEGQLTTSGTGHIRFWKMADTFTGLKLQGQLGKFGRTEISDIHGYVELPDGKVLSGTEWGNMLLWDGGLIKVQITRKNQKPCHTGNIEQFVMDEGEMITIGVDGCVRVWDFESIDTADSTDDAGIFEMDCMNELKVGNNVHLMSMVKSVDPEVENIWYAQDGNGSIWKLDLSFSHTTKAPERLESFHAGQVTALDVSPVSQLMASTAVDRSVRVYDYASKTVLCSSTFNAGTSCLLWLPQIVDPKGSTILAGFDDGVVRALTIARKDAHDAHHKRSSHQPSASLLLKQAFKPHSKRTTTLALDSKGELLATGGADGTVFFLTVDEGFQPIGFIEVPGPVSHMTWSPGHFDKNTLLVFCVNGEVVEIESPEGNTYDTSKTFKITGLNTRQTTFKSIKSRLRREEEEARKQAEEEEKRKEKDRQRRIRRERGLEDEEEEEEEEKEEVEPEPLYIPEEPSPILFGVYSPDDPNRFWVSMGAFDAGYLYGCKFYSDIEKSLLTKEGREEVIGEPITAVPVIDSEDVPIRAMYFGSSGHQVVLGMENGMIRIQTIDNKDGKQKYIPTSSQADLSTFGPHWMLNVHDNNYGHITDVKMSVDDRYLFSCGSDGNLFVFEMMSQEDIEESRAVARAKIPSARKEDEDRVVTDIESQDHYSIELEKQKSEYDKMMKMADERKMEVKRTVAKLRRQFKKLLEKNKELPAHLQLLRKEFEMDPGIRRELDRQTADKINQVHKELAWEAEKHRIGLEKLKSRFKADLECERIVVVSIKTSHQVATYRTTLMPEDFLQLKDEMSRRATMVYDKGFYRDPTRDTTTGQSKKSESLSDTLLSTGAKDATGKRPTVLTGRLGEKVAKQLQKAEKIKQKRLARQAQWDELYSSKPPEDFEDPSDVAAIKEAQENMGDFKLKTAKDYVVPEHLRMNALKKRNQLLTLEELIHKHKSNFNNSVISLRNKKVQLIDMIKQQLEELAKIQEKLTNEQCKELPLCPILLPCETPEKKLEYTKESLLKFKKEMERKALAKKTGGDGGGMFGLGGGGEGREKDVQQKQRTAGKSATPSSQRVISSMSLRTPIPSMMYAASAGRELSPLEEQLRAVEEVRLLHRQEELIQGIQNYIVDFDAQLRMLRHEKFKLDVDLKNADLRRVTLFEELKLLKDFEKREDVFAEKVEAKIREKNDMQSKVSDCQQRLDSKRKDIERLQEKEKALFATFQSSLGENNKFAEFLNRVFKKKIKRAKKNVQTEEGSDEESEESSDDESDWDSEEEDSDEDGLDDSVCPPGCDSALFDNTCALRENRLDFEEAITEEKKTAESLKKEMDALAKKQKIIQTNLKTAEADLEAFQLEKQQKLNELDVVVTLNLSQVEHVVNGQMPQDLSSCLVFTNAGMTQLQKRIRELKEEKFAQRRHYKQHRQQHVQLIKDRKLMENRIEVLQEKCNEMMRLKFGHIVDLEKLEAVGVNRTVEELKERLRLNEGTNTGELRQWDSKIKAKKARITELTQENTERLRQLTHLVGENKTLEKALDTRQTTVGGEFQGVRKTDVEERQRLIQLVQLQAQEIEALKEEIGLLSRKGGHILPPTHPPIPQGSPSVRPPMSGAT